MTTATRRMTLALDEFGRVALDEHLVGSGRSHSAAVEAAVLYYLAARDDARVAWRSPRFVRRRDRERDQEIQLELDGQVVDALEVESRRQGIEPERLAVHALLYFLARTGEEADPSP